MKEKKLVDIDILNMEEKAIILDRKGNTNDFNEWTYKCIWINEKKFDKGVAWTK